MDRQISIGGPVEESEGKLVLRIPLDAGGSELIELAKGISKVEDGLLIIEIPDWLAKELNVVLGSQVVVDNAEGKFRITRND